MRDRIRVGTQFKNITDRSFYNRKNAEDAGFHPIAMEKHNEETQMTDFVPKPLYTKKQLQEFRQKNIVDGRFVTDEQTIQSVEDLEKTAVFVAGGNGGYQTGGYGTHRG